jgi:hypothetical protein
MKKSTEESSREAGLGEYWASGSESGRMLKDILWRV